MKDRKTLLPAVRFQALRALALIVVALVVAGCGRMQAARPTGDPNYRLSLAVQPEPAAVGPTRLTITLADSEGRPVDTTRIQVEGDMTHAGMTPVLADSPGGRGGSYVVPFRWTMAGDWVVNVKVTLADGKTISQQFPVRVVEK